MLPLRRRLLDCVVSGAVCLLAFQLPGQLSRSGAEAVPIELPARGKTGFTLMRPEQTGVTFSNHVDEYVAASNRVLLNGSGVATGDFDRDGLPDVFFCSLNGRNTLYRNLGGWRFEDVTERAGLRRDGRHYRGAVFADVNGDNWLDMLIAVNGAGVQCLVNDRQGRFSDATGPARTASAFGSATLALADVDGNGTLDLYVANNRTDDIRDRGQVDLHMVGGQLVVPPAFKDRLVVTNGQVYEFGEPDQLYLNDGQGHFAPVPWTGGRFRDEHGRPLTQPPRDWALTATFRDINGDGAPDLYVCNDFWTPDRFWINDGKGRFRAAPLLAWRNMCASSMGVDFADIDRDGDLDFFVVDMLSRDARLRKRQKLAQPVMASAISSLEERPQFMRNTLFLNRGDATFAEIANFAGVAASEWSWSPVFLDVDLDGYEDLLITAGHARDVQDLDAAAAIRARQRSFKGFTNQVARQEAFTRELIENMRLYPRLDMPIIAFRNRGNLRFDDVTSSWGTDQLAVHHAIALADFDRDGDLDFAVNNLGAPAGLYRNETVAPRVAVRLRGAAPNTQAIGAVARLLGGPVSQQAQEIVSGGRYLAGSDPLLVFAAGKEKMTLEVTWRNGSKSVVTNVLVNHVYEIAQPTESNATTQVTGSDNRKGVSGPNRSPPLFSDASDLIQHTHHDEPFNDFERQPLLPRRLSQPGPGVSWFDFDADGDEDLTIGSGRGGRLACYRNGGGKFERASGLLFQTAVTADQTSVLGWHAPAGARLLVGSSAYETMSTNHPAVQVLDLAANKAVGGLAADIVSAGPLAMADIDADGDLDLFVGGRVIPGRYPEPTSSRIFRCDGDRFGPDEANAKFLTNIGLVSGAVWSDLTGDGFPELILACEWGPIKVFRNERGVLAPWDVPVRFDSAEQPPGSTTVEKLGGIWNGVTTGDLDGDGRLDILASNWGLNSDIKTTTAQPAVLFYGDLLDRGAVDIIEAEWDSTLSERVSAKSPLMPYAPRRRLDILGRELPSLAEHFRSHRAFSEASISQVLEVLDKPPRKVEARTLATTLFLNRGGHLLAIPLPDEAQFAPSFGVNVADFDGDGHEDVFLAQNFFGTEPETPRLDAGRGLLLRGDGAGKLTAVAASVSGLEIYGEQRGSAVADFDADGRIDLVVTQNRAATRLFRNASATPGIRVRLKGPRGNPNAIGALLRLKSGSQFGAAREIRAGAGYWSQDGAVSVLTFAQRPKELWVRWPGGRETVAPVPADARELTVAHP